MFGLSFKECNPMQHKTLFFPDGDIILAAQDTTKAIVLFRIHKFMLSRWSQVFADMFALPTNPQVQVNETYDDVAVVEMADDAGDLEKLLGVLYDPT